MERPIRVVFVIDSLRPGGAERQLVELIRGLFARGGYELHLVCLLRAQNSYAEWLTPLGLEPHYIQRSCKYDFAGPVFSLARYIRSQRIDLVHTFMNMGSLIGCLAAKMTRRPVVCSAIRDGKDPSRKAKYIKYFLAAAADYLVANSRAGFAGRFRTMRPHFRVVYNGVDFSRFAGDDKATQRAANELGLQGERRVVGMVGSLSLYRDQATLLRAAPRVLSVFPDVVFVFVGDGDQREHLEQLAKQLGIAAQVVFAGFRGDVDRIYPLMDLCVLLSNNRVIIEGISNALIEAMANGVPVIASTGGGTDELIEHNQSGLLVEPHNPEAVADAVLALLGAPEAERSRLARNACQRVRELFALERYVREYEDLYDDLLHRSRR
ncbi:MAG: glycosyltransferase [Desulfobulbus sp.]|jgi:glycosyltransferase involved in cell wall biosynthesis